MRWLAFLMLLSLSMVTRAETMEFVHTDPLGSPVAISNQAGQVIERMQYEPYGANIGQSNGDRPGYTRHVMDGTTGLTYMQQRYYDPIIDRFLSTDPVAADANTGADFNRYLYSNNNPYRFTDPDGRQACSDACQRMRDASDRVGGGIEKMASWGEARVFRFVNARAERLTFSDRSHALSYFGAWAIPLQKHYKREVGANLIEELGKYKVRDFHLGSDRFVRTSIYAPELYGGGRWVAILHTHPTTDPLSGGYQNGRRMLMQDDDVYMARTHRVDNYVVKADYTIQRFNFKSWDNASRAPGKEPVLAEKYYEDL